MCWIRGRQHWQIMFRFHKNAMTGPWQLLLYIRLETKWSSLVRFTVWTFVHVVILVMFYWQSSGPSARCHCGRFNISCFWRNGRRGRWVDEGQGTFAPLFLVKSMLIWVLYGVSILCLIWGRAPEVDDACKNRSYWWYRWICARCKNGRNPRARMGPNIL